VFPGLKPGQRKVLFTCLKRNDKREVKVAQLAGSVAEMSAYHHGEVRSTQCLPVAAQHIKNKEKRSLKQGCRNKFEWGGVLS